MHSTNLLTYLLTYLDEQFLQFSGLGFVTLGPFHCAYIHFYLCVCIVFFFILHIYRIIVHDACVDLVGLKPNP